MIGRRGSGYHRGMLEVTRRVAVPPERVWAVLEDGWLYASWVVGASRMRAVGEGWPAPGQKLHHSAGLWPVVTNDQTVSLESEPPRRLKLQAKGWPAGEATIEIVLERQGDATLLRIKEDATRGPALLVPEPVRQVVLAARNKETLRRLAYIAEHRAHPDSGDGPSAGSRDSRRDSHVQGTP
jgi:uncharacterized protein YndB with AHSA1/START domain